MSEYEYRIEYAGHTIETDDREFVEQLIYAGESDPDESRGGEREVPDDAEHVTMTPDHVPMQMRTDDESDIDEARLEELCQAWGRKSGNSRRYSPDVRAAYCDAAEKLRFVLNDTPWMESP